jgi:hypothetical protein
MARGEPFLGAGREARPLSIDVHVGSRIRLRRTLLVPLHSDFDRLSVPWFQCGQVGTINQDSDTPGHPRAP